jgi:hypothetical protein
MLVIDAAKLAAQWRYAVLDIHAINTLPVDGEARH